MPVFGVKSLSELRTCDPRLIAVFEEVVKHFDCTVLEGHRGEELQRKYFREGKSKKDWPNGEHNKIPSKAVDVVPYPINWKDENRMRYFAGFVVGIGAMMGIKIRWGGDWNMNTDLTDQTFFDLPHFEVED